MILLTIGTQLPFDRLVKALDHFAATVDEPIFGQIGASQYKPKNFEAVASVAPLAFDKRFREARVIVAHAGIGTILTAQRHRKPIVLFPRRASFGEHRNDHQLATCAQLGNKPGIYVTQEEAALAEVLKRTDLEPTDPTAEASGRAKFIGNLKAYLALRK